jgi:hypothetical protein
MAHENLDTWKTTPAVINETVRVTKEFLDKGLKKYKSWEKFKKSPAKIQDIFSGHKDAKTGKEKNPRAVFGQAKKPGGVGIEIIHKFLGGSWKQWMVRQALETLRAEERGELDSGAGAS